MTKTHRCDFCDADEVREVHYQEMVPMGRKRPLVSGFLKDVCSACGAESISEIQMAFNHKIFNNAVRATPEALVPALLRMLRERWSLTQRQASEMFGAGAGAFGKWESGQLPSAPAARLIQCAVHVPGVMEYLAEISDVEISDREAVATFLMTNGSYLARNRRHDAANSSRMRPRRHSGSGFITGPIYTEPMLQRA